MGEEVDLIKNLNNSNNHPLQKNQYATCNNTPNTPPINIPTPNMLTPQVIPISYHEIDVDDQLPDNEYMQDSSTDNIVSKYTNHTQQSTVIPGSLSKTPSLTRNNRLLDTDELAYTQ